MKLVLLSGGSGQRLWPLSNDSRSKQFIKVLKDESENQISMVQRVWSQLRENGIDDESIIATSKSQVDMIRNQLGDKVTIVTEPERRDTFPAIALASVYLYSEMKCARDEVVTMLPVDPFVENNFFNKVKDLEKVINESKADIALIGVKPTYPSEKYGYIVPEGEMDRYVSVNSFKEKPNKDVAIDLISKNALWNCGVFAFKLGYILDLLKEKGFSSNYKELLQQYKNFSKESFDYEVLEKAQNIVATSYDGKWKDLGTWNTLTEEMTTNMIGKGIIADDINNSHIINELDIPITLLGLNNVVVAASPDGILVSDKESSPSIKKYVGKFNNRPMYEERRWGWYRVLDYTKFVEGNEILTKRIGITAGQNLSYQVHYKRTEVWTIVKGEGVFAIDGQLQHVRAGDVIQIPLGQKHALRATTNMEIVEVQTGSELIEEDIHRFALDWNEIETLCNAYVNY
ncbi:sugar phosphate nucleotidyltransferase [Halobacillus sp. ACCC02827]|uniref:sugar phosphate nucleotidyltransferase n=1 Tax=Halobacillus sp. ACCC02827 TaxID=3052090 RepID=UPI002570BD43|nr:sugar phosphate nucleotidyltransferase [Halobacillus sp. ACCC02827]WJE15265.1 sugar phosphate nucleotidyltransferase [Halobacillus sp. ACCC02827]